MRQRFPPFNSPFELNDRRRVVTTLDHHLKQGLTRVSLRCEPKRLEKGNLLAEQLRQKLRTIPACAFSFREDKAIEGYELTLEFANQTQGPQPDPKGWPAKLIAKLRHFIQNKRRERERRIYGSMLRDAVAEAMDNLDAAQRKAFRAVGSQVHVLVHQDQRLYEQLRTDGSFVSDVISSEADLRPGAQLDIFFHLDSRTICAGQPLLDIEIEPPAIVPANGITTVTRGSVRIASVLLNGKEVEIDQPADLSLPTTISRTTWPAGRLTAAGKHLALNLLPQPGKPLGLTVEDNEVACRCSMRYPVLFDRNRKELPDGKRLRSGDTCLIQAGTDTYLVMEIG